jgi:hypothetical protein
MRCREHSVINCDEDMEKALLEAFAEYASYTKEILKANYNFVWFDVRQREKSNSITFLRQYTNYNNPQDVVVIETMFQSEEKELKEWILRMMNSSAEKKFDAVKIETFANGFSFIFGKRCEFENTKMVESLIAYIKANPEKVSFIEGCMYYQDECGEIIKADSFLMRSIMSFFMGVKF